RAGYLSVVNHVAIKLTDRVMIGVKTLRHFIDTADGHIDGQVSIDGAQHGIAIETANREEIGNLTQCMDSRVGAACGITSDAFFAGYLGNGGSERSLHGAKARLSLPAIEIAAVVGHGQLQVTHDRQFITRTRSKSRPYVLDQDS